MADTDTTQEEVYVPTARDKMIAEIAARANAERDEEVAESASMPAVDEDNVPIAAAPEETSENEESSDDLPPSSSEEAPAEATQEAAAPPFDPMKEYEITVDGVKMKVPGQKILDAGYRTFQKETAADLRLSLATRLAKEADERLRSLEPKPQPSPDAAAKSEAKPEPSESELAEAIQFGTKEQAAEAIRALRARSSEPLSPEKIGEFVRNQIGDLDRRMDDRLEFREAAKFVQEEYGDLLSDSYLSQIFFSEENRRRQAGSQLPYRDLYKEIGDELRSHFNRPKPSTATSTDTRKAAKRNAATPPQPASVRLARVDGDAEKPKTPSEIISSMAAARGQRPTI